MKLPACFALCLLALSAGSVRADVPDELPVSQQWTANLPKHFGAEPSAWRVLNLSHWQELWEQSLHREPPSAPDFGRSSIVVVAAGERPTGGYRVEVVRAVKESNKWVIEFVVHPPTPDAFVTQALTYPASIAVFSSTAIFRPQVRDVTPPEAPDKPATR